MNTTLALSLVLTATLCIGPAHARDASALVAGYEPLRPVIKPRNVRISPNALSGHVVVKFRRGSQVANTKSRLGGADVQLASGIMATHGLTDLEPLIAGDVSEIQAQRMAAEDRSRMNLPDMTLYMRHAIDNPALAATVINELNELDEVEIAFFSPRPEVASYPSHLLESNNPRPRARMATTPHFTASQAYLNAAPGGINARAAWTLPGGDGAGTQVIDIEFGWQLTHEDLSKGSSAVVIGLNTGDNNHGTAVLGEMVSDPNGIGMTGIAHGTDIGVSSVADVSMATAMTLATNASSPGDCILIELHAPGPHFDFDPNEAQIGYVPMEYFQDNFDAILNAYAAGAIVCEAAGNGAENLGDAFIYGTLFDTTFRNSQAIMCGAGNPPVAQSNDRSKLGFSNWGPRVDLQGYGIQVYTAGYGDLYSGGSKDTWYTNSFSGTSSASPIVTGAVLCASGVYQNMLGVTVDADSIRNLLVATGSPQTQPLQVRHIGPRPDLKAALGSLFDPVDTVWYGRLDIEPGKKDAVPIMLSNSHPVGEIRLPFRISGTAPVLVDSLTRGPRTSQFEDIRLAFDNRFGGQIAFQLRADAGGGTPPLASGSGVIGYLWVTAAVNATPGQNSVVDSAWLGTSEHLQLTSFFDDGYPDAFFNGGITITGLPCDCSLHGDINGDGVISVLDVVLLTNTAFRDGAPAPTDQACPHATRADYNCDGIVNVVDVVRAVDIAFRNGPPPCDPCIG